MLQVLALVLEPAFLHHLARRIAPGRGLQGARGHEAVEIREVTAAKVIRQVARGKAQPTAV